VSVLAVIPARYASIRFPGKPLAADTGKYMVQHVVERVSRSRSIDRIIVATDDERIVTAVRSFGGQARMTRSDHISGTDRVAEVAAELALADDDLILNVQGDEPEISPQALDHLIDRMAAGDDSCRIGTLAAQFPSDGPCEGPGSPWDPNCVKVVLDAAGRAMYFSRSPIPYPRKTGGKIDRPSRWLLHLGVYGFRADMLRTVAASRLQHAEPQLALLDAKCQGQGSGPSCGPIVALDDMESLEQLRWLERGLAIAVVLVDHAFVGVDTPEDYAAFVRRTKKAQSNERSVRV